MGKNKLTLSVDTDVIEKAKDLGLNLSEITENALKITSFGKEKENTDTRKKLISAFQKVFQTFSPILKKWNAQIRIGGYMKQITWDTPKGKRRDMESFDYYLSHDEIYLWYDSADEQLKTWQLSDDNLPVENFSSPEILIKEFINTLHKVEEENKSNIKKLEVIDNIIKLSGLIDDKI